MSFAVVQDGYCVMAVGRDWNEAIENAEPNFDSASADHPDLVSNLVSPDDVCVGDIYIAPCSDELARRVERDGGDSVPFEWVDGIVQVAAESAP